MLTFSLELVYSWISSLSLWPCHYRNAGAGAREQGRSSQSGWTGNVGLSFQVALQVWARLQWPCKTKYYTLGGVKGRGRKGGRTCPSDCGNSAFSPDCEPCDELWSSAGSCLMTSISTGQLCLVHGIIGDGQRRCGWVVTLREMQPFPVEENKPETRCVSYCSVWDGTAL